MKDDGWDNVPEPPAQDIDDLTDVRTPGEDIVIFADHYGDTRQSVMQDLYALTEAWAFNEGGDDDE